MTIPPQKLREALFQMLYGLEYGNSAPDELTILLSKELALAKSAVRELQDKADQIRQAMPQLEVMIGRASSSYALARIHTVEKTILMLGLYEMLYDQTIPPKVAISEAMRLARKFATPEASKYINALLDYLYKESCGQAVDKAELDALAIELEQAPPPQELLQRDAVTDLSGLDQLNDEAEGE